MLVLSLLVTTLLIALSLVITAGAARRARGTTLVAPLVWTLISLLFVTVDFVFFTVTPTASNFQSEEMWWLVALCSAFCPLMSLLGAKRPQNRAWQWIVLSFWLVAAFPAIQGLALQPGEKIVVPIIWRWLYTALLLLGAVNYLPTRYALAGLLAAIGQALLFSPFLPIRLSLGFGYPLIGTSVLCAAVCVARLTASFRPIRRTEPLIQPLTVWTRVWLDFRNAYGLLWGARMMERIESLLQSSNAPAWLQWNGFHSPSSGADQNDRQDSQDISHNAASIVDGLHDAGASDPIAAVEPGIRNLLRRFVSNEWIDQRLHSPP
jgi:hypothetical protein